ncbi:hypothetical protein K1719_033955 [Acacia pycnantha]|nr:hypothetical protein K1719_033955 [Acacia pycnantha]
MPPTRVVSFLQCDSRSNNWSICIKVIGFFWDIPSTRMHRQITYNVVLTDAEVIFCFLESYVECTVINKCPVCNVVGLVTRVYSMTDVVVNGETENQFNFEIMDERGSSAFWAWDSYSRVLDKDDVVVALLWVKMKRLSDGEDILFSSHCELSKAHFNYDHPAVIDFRLKLNEMWLMRSMIALI